ncbi:MAG: 2'-5' RNA ligase [Nitrospinaceae bacterium]|nr:MAG: 2'-5' RNA ligase [Nitrospinaceae bacterium]
MCDLRLFLAIDIPNSARGKITAVQSFYKTLNLDASWVKPSNMHLTVKFLGNTQPGLIPKIKERIARITKTTPVFSIKLRNVGAFPNLSRPRVLWVGVEETEGRLDSLKEKIELEMMHLGFPADHKKTVHHLTLGRIKSRKGVEGLKKAVESSQRIDIEPFDVSSVQLIKSALTPKGSIYTVQEEFVFNESISRQ